MQYKLVSSENNAELIVKKSKFISTVFYVEDEQQVKNILLNLKKEHKDASHICYGYVLEPNLEKCSDDGEPQGTAGLPILTILKQSKLTNALAVVIRYYGGVKLGAGGLIRAYSNAIKQALNLVQIMPYELFIEVLIEVLIEVSYEELNKLNLLQNENWFELKNKEFNEQIKVIYKVKEEKVNEFKSIIQNLLKRII